MNFKKLLNMSFYKIVVFTMLVSILPLIFIVNVSAEENWIDISTVEDLQSIANDDDANYRLVNDIDLEGIDWQPIETFKGTLDGQGYEIKNLTSNSDGLFIELSRATVKNIGLVDININSVEGQSYTNMGGLSKTLYKSNINRVYVTGEINSNNSAAGLIGSIQDDTNYPGEMTTISEVYVDVDINTSGDVASGLVSNIKESADLKISDVRVDGNITSKSITAGIIYRSSYELIMDRVLFTGTLNSTNKSGLMHDINTMNGRYSTVNDSFWDKNTSGTLKTYKDLGTALSTEQMKNSDSFTSFDFLGTWDIVESETYPTLKFYNESINSEENTVSNEDKATFGLIGGGLELITSPVITFGDIVLGNTREVYTTSFESFFTVKDFRGTGEGWRIDLSASPFSIVEPEGGFAEGTEAYELPTGSLLLDPVTDITRVGEGLSDLPVNLLTDTTVADNGTISIIEAAPGTGLGEFNFSFGQEALSLVIDPSTAKVDTVNYPEGKTPYESTLSWDIVTAP